MPLGLLLPQRDQPGEVIERDHLVAPALIDIPAVQFLRLREFPLALAEIPQAEHQDRGLGPLLEALLQPPGNPVEMYRPVLALVAQDHIKQARDEGLRAGHPLPELLAQIEGGPDATGAGEESDQGQAVLEAILLGGEFLEQPLGELGLAEFLRQHGEPQQVAGRQLGPIGTRLDQLDGLADLVPGLLNARLEHQEIQGIRAKHLDLLGQFLGLDQCVLIRVGLKMLEQLGGILDDIIDVTIDGLGYPV